MLSNPLSLNRQRRRGDEGFTLIELLVVVVILGILIGIAIPVYLNYRKSANDKAAQADVRSAVSALEVCNSDTGYPTSLSATASSSGGAATIAGCSQTVNVSGGTQLSYTAPSGTTTTYKLVGNNTGGSGKWYCYNSATGGSVRSLADTVTTSTAALAACS